MPIDSSIRELISKYGYLSIDSFMNEVVSSNSASYYRQKNTLGEEGDFTTAPELSQLFGEIIGLWVIEKWQQLNEPKKINIIELGPGRGVLMRDVLNVAKLKLKFFDAIEIQLIEINPFFKKLQEVNLSQFNLNIKWLERIHDINPLPTIIIANEFFDSLPIKQYIKIKDKWYESVLVIDPKDGQIKYDKKDINAELQAYLLQEHINAKDGAIIEESLIAHDIIKFITNHIMNYSGFALIIDYGYDIPPIKRTREQYNSTLQAIKEHKYHPLIASLGEADLSAHVDFYALRNIAAKKNIVVNEIISQRNFLLQNGLKIRSELLQAKLPHNHAEIIKHQVERLIYPKYMGELFKVLILNKF